MKGRERLRRGVKESSARGPRPGPRRDPKTPPRPRSIEVHIGQLVLHGFTYDDRRPIAEAIERELTHLLTDKGSSLEVSFEVQRINAGEFQLERNGRPESSGTKIARAIYGGLRP